MWRRYERVAALAACAVVAVLVSRHVLRRDVFSDDAFVHQYWMWQFRDPELFRDALTEQLRESARYPPGYVGLFWLASHIAGPIAFGEWLGVALMAVSGFLVFLVVRDHTDWRPAAWIGAALFLALIDIHRFHGGFPRAFVHPVVLLTVLLAMRRRHAAAAAVAAGGALFYPTAAILAVGVLLLTALKDRRRWAYAGAAFAAMVAIVLASGGAPAVLTETEARGYAEFGRDGPLHFFVPSTLTYLTQNRSGFDLRFAGMLLGAVAVVLLVVPGNLRRIRHEVLALPVVAIGGWAAAQLVLFRLYLPHRYTYPLVAFFAIAIAVTLRPTLRAPAAAIATALALLAVVAADQRGGLERGSACPGRSASAFLSTLPKDAVIAGDPIDLKCVPGTARRAVVTSIQLAPSYERDAFLDGRERMFATLRAVYGPSPDAIAALADRYGATHLWVRRSGAERWMRRREPYGSYVRRLRSEGERAALRLPSACRRWQGEAGAFYEIACVRVP